MKQKSILVLDDDADLAYTFQIAFETEAFSVIAFTEPLQAIEYFKTNSDKFFLIITDLRMRPINGIEFASKVREIDDDIKILLITAYASQYLKDNPLFTSAKFEKIIEKPVAMDKIIEMAKSAVN